MERPILREGAVREGLVLNAHLARQPVEEFISDPVPSVLATATFVMMLARHMHRRATHVHLSVDVPASNASSSRRSAHVQGDIASDLARVCSELLEQSVGLEQIDERFEALALLVNLLVLAPLE